MKEVNMSIPATGFPSQTATDAVKETLEFGLQVGQAIQYEWFKKDNGSARYYNQWRDFHKRRLYARGEQSVDKYKSEMAVEGDLSYLNLDWTPIPIIPKFVDIVVNGMSERVFKIKATSQDALSQSKRNAFQDMIEGQMVAKDVLAMIQKNSGVNPFVMDIDEVPANDEELSLYMQLKYKPAIEIAEEEAINTVFDENKYSDLGHRYYYDLVNIGIGVGKHEFLKGSGVKLSYVDPANLVYSYTEDPYFKDVFYWGEIKTVHATELMKIDPTLSKDDMESILKKSQQWYNYFSVAQLYKNDMFFNDTCTLMYFNYKTTKKIVYKKKILDNGNFKMIQKDDSFNPPAGMMEEGRFEKVEKTIDVWYDGIMVMGTNIILKWELARNMVRPKSSSQFAIPNYVAVAPRMYKGSIESLVSRMIPFADLIQMTHLKLQQVIARVVPDGVFIDADGLNEVDLGNGAAYNPEDALRLYFQTGSVIGRSYTQDGEFNNARVPIMQLASNSGISKVQMLISSYNHYLDMIRTVTGLNEARDGSTPNPESLVGLQKMAALNSNTATRHILDGGLFIFRSLAEAITYRISDILEYADFREDFINRIGKYNTQILNDIRDLYLYDFGIVVEVSPDEDEKSKLEANIQIALSKGDINLEDAIDIREIKNIKLANQLLKMKRKANYDRAEKMQMQNQALAAQQQAQIQQIASQSALQKIQAESQGKMQIKQAEVAFDMEKMKLEAQLKSQLMAEEFNYNLKLAEMNGINVSKLDDKKEEGKAKRISQQNSEQSRLIEQRKNNLPPIKFESNEDSMDGFDLAEFEPK